VALEIIGIYGNITGGTQDALAQIDVPQDGVIRGFDWDVHGNMDADGEFLDVELSFIATNQLSTNDIRGRMSSVSAQVAMTTSGVFPVWMQKWIGPIELMVSGGERLYMHVVSTAGVTGMARLNLHFDGGATVTRRSARR